MKINQKAWGVLSDTEKVIIQLSHIDKKSSWEIGAILNKAHYKTLELKNRADRLLRLFQEYFDTYDDFIPRSIKMHPDVAEYLHLCVMQRKKVKQAYLMIDNPEFRKSFNRERLIDEELRKVKALDTQDSRDFIDMLVEFDRWNNFRVLPYYWQEPSAFRRRNRSSELKILRKAVSIHELTIKKVISDFSYRGSEKVVYVAIIRSEISKCISMPMRSIPKSIKTLSDMGFYIFRDKGVCDSFVRDINTYFFMSESPSRKGIRFWKDYAEYIKGMVNYREIQHILAFRRFREDAPDDTEC